MDTRTQNLLSKSLHDAAAVFGYRQVTQQLITVWIEALDGYPQCDIGAAFGEWMKTGQKFPTPANIREIIGNSVSVRLDEEQRRNARTNRDTRGIFDDAPDAVFRGIQAYLADSRKVAPPLHDVDSIVDYQVGLCALGRRTNFQLDYIRRVKKCDFDRLPADYVEECARKVTARESGLKRLDPVEYIRVERLKAQREKEFQQAPEEDVYAY